MDTYGKVVEKVNLEGLVMESGGCEMDGGSGMDRGSTSVR